MLVALAASLEGRRPGPGILRWPRLEARPPQDDGYLLPWHTRSRLSLPRTFRTCREIAGVRLATGAAGIRYKGRTDVLLAVLDKGTAVAGVFTRSKCPSAPVEWCRAQLAGGKARALVVNSGNANAFTGKSGRDAVQAHRRSSPPRPSAAPGEVFLASTGVIGEPLDATQVRRRDGRPRRAGARPDGWPDAAKAIMTTDTFPKVATATAKLGGATVTINGIAKGAGMIAPDMATMLCFVFTDAPIAAPRAAEAVSRRRRPTPSTPSRSTATPRPPTRCCLRDRRGGRARRAADRQAGRPRGSARSATRSTPCSPISPSRSRVTARARASSSRSMVDGAVSKRSARRIAHVDRQLAAGQDRDRRRGRQWGRVVMAVGKAGEPADRDKLSIWFGGIRVAHRGRARSRLRRGGGLGIHAAAGDRHQGRHSASASGRDRVLTCDLTKEYIAINGDYRS